MYQQLAYDLQQTLRTVEDAGLFQNATATFLARLNDPADPAVNAMGQADIATFNAIAGLQNIPCMFSVWRAKPQMDGVARREERFDTMSERHVLLDGYFPQIKQRDVVDITIKSVTTRYELMAVESDSQLNLTRCAARVYTL